MTNKKNQNEYWCWHFSGMATTLIITNPMMAQTQETITPIMTHALAGASGKEVLMYTVDFPAGLFEPYPQCTMRRYPFTCWRAPSSCR